MAALAWVARQPDVDDHTLNATNVLFSLRNQVRHDPNVGLSQDAVTRYVADAGRVANYWRALETQARA